VIERLVPAFDGGDDSVRILGIGFGGELLERGVKRVQRAEAPLDRPLTTADLSA